MAQPNKLEITCNKCKVSDFCPSKGASPLKFENKIYFCYLVGGYGRTPVDECILSEKSKELVKKQGGCLTIAEVPVLDTGSNMIYQKIEKIFHKPVLHAREIVDGDKVNVHPKSHI